MKESKDPGMEGYEPTMIQNQWVLATQQQTPQMIFIQGNNGTKTIKCSFFLKYQENAIISLETFMNL